MQMLKLSLIVGILASVARASDPETANAAAILGTALGNIRFAKPDDDLLELLAAGTAAKAKATGDSPALSIPPEFQRLPQCFGREDDKAQVTSILNLVVSPFLFYDHKKCVLNGLASLLPAPAAGKTDLGPELNSAFSDLVTGPLSWIYFMTTEFGSGATSCVDIPIQNCTFINTHGMCVVGIDGNCTQSAYSIPLFPIIPKYTCPGSRVSAVLNCWGYAAVTGSCDDQCAWVDPSNVAMSSATELPLFASFANDKALQCWPNWDQAAFGELLAGLGAFVSANMKKINKLSEGDINYSPLPWNYPAPFVTLFSTEECNGIRGAQTMFFDIISLQKGDTSFLGTMANECDDEAPKRKAPTTARCKKIGHKIDLRGDNVVLRPIPFDPVAPLVQTV